MPKDSNETIYATSINGKTKEFKLGENGEYPTDTTLHSAGFSEEPVFFSSEAPSGGTEPVETPKLRIVHTLAEIEAQGGIPTPPVPVPEGPNEAPPDQSVLRLVTHDLYYPDGSSKKPFYVKQQGKNRYYPSYNKDQNPNKKKIYYCSEPKMTKPQHLDFYTYWVSLYSHIVESGVSFSKTLTSTIGMSKSLTKTLSAEVGVVYGGLSASISASISYGVTITKSSTVSDTYKIEVPEGKIGVWTLWQMVERFVIATDDARPEGSNLAYKPLEWDGKLKAGNLIRQNAKLKENIFDNNSTLHYAQLTLFDE